MKIISWNVNGIRAAERKGFLAWLSEESPDILCIQETKAHPEQLSEELLAGHGYHTFWASAERRGYSGVATFCKTKPNNVQIGLGIPKYDSEGRVIITDYDNFRLYNIYFPNGQKDEERLQFKLDFYDALLPIVNQEKESGKNVIICGDWNTAHKEIDLANPKANANYSGFMPIERERLDWFVEHGWVDTFRHFHEEPNQYSWWTYRFGARARNVGWRIDYFFVNEEFVPQVKDAFINQHVMGSDHCPITIEIRR